LSFLPSLPAWTLQFAQTPQPTQPDAVRVKIIANADGSRTVYQFDGEKHEATATTTDAEGKTRGKIHYQIVEVGRFSSAIAFGPDEKFLFKSIYKYDPAGRLEQETHVGEDGAVINRIFYKYNQTGKLLGYSIFDPAAKLISGNATPAPTTTPAKRRNALGR
jgi:hypothetical protein